MRPSHDARESGVPCFDPQKVCELEHASSELRVCRCQW